MNFNFVFMVNIIIVIKNLQSVLKYVFALISKIGTAISLGGTESQGAVASATNSVSNGDAKSENGEAEEELQQSSHVQRRQLRFYVRNQQGFEGVTTLFSNYRWNLPTRLAAALAPSIWPRSPTFQGPELINIWETSISSSYERPRVCERYYI